MRITGGAARGIILAAPKNPGLRPTTDRVRGAIFQLIGSLVEDALALDLYAGTGALGIEALSRGATLVDFVEQDPRLCQAIRQNLERSGFSQVGRIHRARVERAIGFLEGPYRLVLMDPPYALGGAPQVLVGLNRPGLLATDALVVLEHSSRDQVEDRYGNLQMNTQRTYGDTAVSIYEMAAPEEGD